MLKHSVINTPSLEWLSNEVAWFDNHSGLAADFQVYGGRYPAEY